jgi:hypothetical protein
MGTTFHGTPVSNPPVTVGDMNIYPYSSPIILTDEIFARFGGQMDTSTPEQRAAAYMAAEKQATNHIGTLLLPTLMTRTFYWSGDGWISTDYGYVHRIVSVSLIYADVNCQITEEVGCGRIMNNTFGYISIECVLSHCSCGVPSSYPYQVQVTYEAGLPVGAALQGDFLAGLVIAAQINLNEMVFPSSNESAGDVGVTSFSSLDYSETRKASSMKRTAFGSSARANKAAQLIENAVHVARKAIVL